VYLCDIYEAADYIRISSVFLTKYNSGDSNQLGTCGMYGGTGDVGTGIRGGGTPQGRRQLGRLKRRFEDNIKIDLQNVG